MASSHKVFVYGTLRPWEEGHYLPATHFLPGFKMYSAGSFPYIMQEHGSGVWGNILSVTDKQLKQLDKIEGLERGLYTREKVRVRYWENNVMHPMSQDEVFVYVAGPLLLPNVIESGDWEQYQQQLYGV